MYISISLIPLLTPHPLPTSTTFSRSLTQRFCHPFTHPLYHHHPSTETCNHAATIYPTNRKHSWANDALPALCNAFHFLAAKGENRKGCLVFSMSYLYKNIFISVTLIFRLFLLVFLYIIFSPSLCYSRNIYLCEKNIQVGCNFQSMKLQNSPHHTSIINFIKYIHFFFFFFYIYSTFIIQLTFLNHQHYHFIFIYSYIHIFPHHLDEQLFI